jgi:Bifunctional DNA primase/polymerase, N-terminal
MLHESPDINDYFVEAALQYLSLGYRPIALVRGEKSAAVRWKKFQADLPIAAEVIGMFSEGTPNIALVTGNGVVVVDVDDPLLLDEVIEKCGDTPMRTQTPRGGLHLWFRMRNGVHYGNAVRVKNRALDLRCEGAYAVVPWSTNADGVPYRWIGPVLPAEELPLLRVSWLRERKRPKPVVMPEENVAMTQDRMRTRVVGSLLRPDLPPSRSDVKNPEAYCLRVKSVQGSNGSKGLVRVVCVMRDAGRTPQQTFDYVRHVWGPICSYPEWADHEIWHAIRRHFGLRET